MADEGKTTGWIIERSGIRSAIIAWLCVAYLFGGCNQKQDLSVIDGPVPFKHIIIDKNPPGGADCCTDVCATGDLNGDGFSDLVLGSENDPEGGLVWYSYPLWRRHLISPGNFTTDAKTADIDGDGFLDVIACDYKRGIFWYKNPGLKEEAWQPHLISGTSDYAHDLVIGDVDGDKDLDIVNCDKKSVTIWLQTSPGVWKDRQLIKRKGEGTALADLDSDGDLDVILGGIWLEAPENPYADKWNAYPFCPDWPGNARVAVGDINGNGRMDVALCVSEGKKGPLAWFETPEDPHKVPWKRNQIGSKKLKDTHSLNLADLDLDGDLDLVAAEMHTGGRRVLVYLHEGENWVEELLSTEGSHNMQVVDLDRDGDWDVVGKNYAGKQRVFEAWENLTSDRRLIPDPDAVSVGDGWKYISLDSDRGPEQQGKTGLCSADLNGDSRLDIIAGSLIYINPGDPEKKWPVSKLPGGMDIFFAQDIDGDKHADLIGFEGDKAYWLEDIGNDAKRWESRLISDLPDARTQGYIIADILAGGKPELIFTRGKNLFFFKIPDNPRASTWPLVKISGESEEEGVAAGDFDRDGDVDIVTPLSDGHHLGMFVNPGLPAAAMGDWPFVRIGVSKEWMDRVSAADINRDGLLDVVVTEESRDWDYNASIAWYKAPADPLHEPWQKNIIAVLRSINSLDIADFDDDGLMDLAVAEHTDMRPGEIADDNLTLLLLNRNNGKNWETVCVDRAPRSSHLGARAWDLDDDGDRDLVSIAWQQFKFLHAWLNPGK
jgi:hypothetical protein